MKKQILVTQSSMPGYCEYIKEIRKLWKTKWLTNNGAIHNRLKEELKAYLTICDIDLFTNGHMAIELGLLALNLPKGSEVITTPFTFASTTQAIVRCGLKPVFCDINEKDYTIDVAKLEKLINKNTSAILPVHVYGNVCDVEAIERIAKKHKLKVLYDAAHAFGVRYKEKGIAEYGDISCFSFHATKVFNTIEGGAACFADEQIKKRLASIKNFGLVGEDVQYVGANAKMNEFCAAMGVCNLRHIEREIGKRKKVVERYLQNLRDLPGVKLNTNKRESVDNYAYFPIMIDEKVFGTDRQFVLDELKKNNIVARKYFYPATNEFSCYKGMFDLGETPVASYMSKRVLTLPLYADLKIKTVDEICNIIKNCYKGK